MMSFSKALLKIAQLINDHQMIVAYNVALLWRT